MRHVSLHCERFITILTLLEIHKETGRLSSLNIIRIKAINCQGVNAKKSRLYTKTLDQFLPIPWVCIRYRYVCM